MSTFPEQFSAASKSGIESQLDLFKALGLQACDGAARLIALNIDNQRAAIDNSAAAVRQIAGFSDPFGLFAQRAPHQQFERMMAWSRDMFAIAADLQAGLVKPVTQATPLTPAPAPAPAAAAPAPVAQAAPVIAAPPAPEVPAQVQPERSARPGRKPVVAVTPEAAPQAVASARPIAKAAGKVAGQAPAPTAAAVMPDTPEVHPGLKPVDAAPPPASFQQELLPPRRGGKKR